MAAVIRNRQLTGRWGDTASQVVRAQNQFEPWNPGSGNNPRRFDPASPEYQRAATIVQGIYSGELPDPTGGATHFMAPSLQSALGRSTPSWARGTPLATIGGHQFFAPDGQVSPATVAASYRTTPMSVGPTTTPPSQNPMQTGSALPALGAPPAGGPQLADLLSAGSPPAGVPPILGSPSASPPQLADLLGQTGSGPPGLGSPPVEMWC